MAIDQGRITFGMTAGTTFSNGDLDKIIAVNSSGHAVIGPSTASGNIVGTLLSVTGTTAGAGVEKVTIGAFIGVGNVFMAGSTSHQGNTVAASSFGLGIAPTSDQGQLGTILIGSSGTTGRKHSVAFAPLYDVLTT